MRPYLGTDNLGRNCSCFMGTSKSKHALTEEFAGTGVGTMDVDGLYQNLKDSGKKCQSLLKKYLTPSLFQKLKEKSTDYGGTLAHCIRSGIVLYGFVLLGPSGKTF